MLKVRNVSGGYSGHTVIDNLSFEVEKGEFFGILGPNGSGKTTLLKMMAGLNPPSEGTILLKEKELQSYGSKELAKMTAVLPQFTESFFTYKVREIVSLGRYPYQKGLFKQPSRDDLEAVEKAIEQTAVTEFAEKAIQSLSGGEKQRVYLAQALAQEPELLLLDEPTNHLDISHQKQLLDGLKKWVDKEGLTVVAIFHDLNLAGLYCDRLLLLKNGLKAAIGTPKGILNEQTVFDVYGTSVRQLFHPELPRPIMTVSPDKSDSEKKRMVLSELQMEETEEMIRIQAPVSMKTFSSAVVGAGFSWKRYFINRHVSGNYGSRTPEIEMKEWLEKREIPLVDTVAMMTAVQLANAAVRTYERDGYSIKVLVTAGTGDAVDVSLASYHERKDPKPGTINGMIFIDGYLKEEAFVQAVMTATEAKVKALQDLNVRDFLTGTPATGTSTDSLLVAATQRGETFPYAGTGTPLGKLIGLAVYECMTEAIEKDRKAGLR